ncbi:hypothetical protein [Nonomuraea dietziae]|uniref:hypothetical protein n=1 Tax=Nonomuraea dietziae TaxID=65515 RepID=UPI0031DB67D0
MFWRVYLPLATSALAAVFILNFTFIWNDLLFGLTLTQTAEVRPVMTALAGLVTDVYAGTPVPVGLARGAGRVTAHGGAVRGHPGGVRPWTRPRRTFMTSRRCWQPSLVLPD